MQADDRGAQIAIPYKQPRQSHKNPAPHVSDEPKAAHTALSRVCLFVAHAIGGMKRYALLVYKFRNHKKDFEDEVIGICAGLWNLALSY